MGVVQDYGTPKLPLRRPFANLSRPSTRPSRIGTGNMPNEPGHFGSGLGPGGFVFREAFADFSPKKYNFRN